MIGDDLFKAVSVFGRIEWGRGGGSLGRAPFLVWRFAPECQDAADEVVRTVARFQGRLKWVAWRHSRNCVLKPDLVKQFEDANTFRTDVEAANAFALRHPDVVDLALQDAPELARHIRASRERQT